MDDTFGRSLVELELCKLERCGRIVGSCKLGGVLDTRLQLASDSLVAFGCLSVGENSLFLALDVCHVGRVPFGESLTMVAGLVA